MALRYFTWTEVNRERCETVHKSLNECNAFLDGKTLYHTRPNYVYCGNSIKTPIALTAQDIETIKKTKGNLVELFDTGSDYQPGWRHDHGNDVESTSYSAPPLPPFPQPDSLSPVLKPSAIYDQPTNEWMRTTRKRLYEQLLALIPLRVRFERIRSRSTDAFLGGIPKHATQASTSQYLLTFHRHGTRLMRCIETITTGMDAFEETVDAMERFNEAQSKDFFPEDPDDYDADDTEGQMPAIDADAAENHRAYMEIVNRPGWQSRQITICVVCGTTGDCECHLADEDKDPETRSQESSDEEITPLKPSKESIESLEHGIKALLRPDPGSIYFNFVQ